MKIENVLNELKGWALSERPLDIMTQAVEQGRSEFMNRVFNSEVGAKDINSKGLGKYSNPYADYRKSLGRQTKVVDLNLTGSLFRDIKTVRSEGGITIAVPSVTEREKIADLERRYRKNIFDLNESEKKTIKTVLKKNYDLDIKDIINGVL
jgi:hypothetical protein